MLCTGSTVVKRPHPWNPLNHQNTRLPWTHLYLTGRKDQNKRDDAKRSWRLPLHRNCNDDTVWLTTRSYSNWDRVEIGRDSALLLVCGVDVQSDVRSTVDFSFCVRVASDLIWRSVLEAAVDRLRDPPRFCSSAVYDLFTRWRSSRFRVSHA